MTAKQLVVNHLNDRTPLPEDGELNISKSQLTQLMLESHRKSMNSAEEIMCLKEIGKINGLYDVKAPSLTINIEQHVQKLEVMSDEELLKLSGGNQNLFSTPRITADSIEDAEIVSTHKSAEIVSTHKSAEIVSTHSPVVLVEGKI